MSDLLNRKGIVEISRTLIMNSPEDIIGVLKDVLIVEVRSDFMQDIVIYGGCSKHFDVVLAGEEIPKYYAICTKDDNFNIKVEWKKIKKVNLHGIN